MEAEASATSADSPARRVLLEQVRLSRAQRRNENFGAALKALTGLAGFAVAGALGVAAWQASQSAALVIEAFSVPPELGQRGMTGQVVAARILDRMTDIQGGIDSQRAPSSFARAWDGGIEVQIPQTGITLSELKRELRAWLGHDTHISGEVVRTVDGLALTVRPGATFAGPDATLDDLIQRGAEAAFGRTQPYRYAIYLRGQGRLSEATLVYERLVRQGSAGERAWGEVGLGNIAKDTLGNRAALAHFRAAERLKSTQVSPARNIGNFEYEIGHPELARAAYLRARRVVGDLEVRPEVRPVNRDRIRLGLALIQGDYAAAVAVIDAGSQGANQNMLARLVAVHLALHDVSAARAALTRSNPSAGIATGTRAMDTIVMNVQVLVAAENWAAAMAEAAKAAEVRAKAPGVIEQQVSQLDPLVAWAMARSGDMAGAQALIARTPDSYDAVIMRGRLAELAGDRRIADHWFGQAARMAASVPFAYQAWAEARLYRGDAAGAVAEATLAHKVGPHFADPLEYLGEALLARGDAKAAAEKFAAAAKLTPRWGRLHLKWGEALSSLGKADEAAAKWRAAATMDLTSAERARAEVLLAKRTI